MAETAVRLIERAAQAGQRAIPCFDIAGGNPDIAMAIGETLTRRGGFALLSSTPDSISSYHGMERFAETVDWVARECEHRVSPHLDHARALEPIQEALRCGVRSIMFDGSFLPVEENAAATSSVVAVAHGHGASVEAELGVIGGKEDEIVAEGGELPSLEECRSFVERCRPDLFAPAIGTQHGPVKEQPAISWELVEGLKSHTPTVELVLHGTTGLETASVKRALDAGFSKVNYATAIRMAFNAGVQASLNGASVRTKPQTHLAAGRSHVAATVEAIMDALAEL